MQTVLVTGGARGIGRELCIALSNAGYAVAINYNASKEQAEELAAALPNAIAVKADISNSREVALMFSQVNASIGAPHILVNNAGLAWQGLLTDMAEEEFDALYAVDLKGVFLASRAVLPAMLKNHSGRIINISSIWGIVGASCEVGYSAMKAGVIGFTKALAKEVGPSGITVNCVAPGVIPTEMCGALSEETMEGLANEAPLCRLGTCKDVANAVLYLAGDGAAFITGQVISVDGGIAL